MATKSTKVKISKNTFKYVKSSSLKQGRTPKPSKKK